MLILNQRQIIFGKELHVKLQFVGGASTVTGSCYYLQINKIKFLVECGMHQGNGAEEINKKPFPFNPAEIDFVFVTHAHIDHSGLLPKLGKEGFKGVIITTDATRDLLGPMLLDSAGIQQSNAEWLTKRGMRIGAPPVEPLYTISDVESILTHFDVKEYQKIYHLGNGVKYRFLDAGHILGSSTLEFWFQDSSVEKRLVFSGDIGKRDNPVIKDPTTPPNADYVVMESTYGNRSHKPIKESIDELVFAIKTTFKRGGNVYIPSFAVGRSQDLIWFLNNLVKEGRLYKIDVYLDSPLAEQVTRIYAAHPEYLDEDARKLFTSRESDHSIRLHFVRSIEDSMALNKIKSGSIIIAGSGMCDGGRIRHHLKHNLWRPECSVIFVGFQAKGSLGRRIVEGARAVNILGEEIAVRANIVTINGFSAHAGKEELVAWLSSFTGSPRIYIVHGEEDSAIALVGQIKEKYGFEAARAHDGDVVDL